MLKVLTLVVCIFLTSFAHSSEVTTKVLKVGCHIDKSMCFVYVDQPIPNTSNCLYSDSLRWDGVAAPNSNAILSVLLAAQVSGKSVRFGQVGCYQNFTTFAYAYIE